MSWMKVFRRMPDSSWMLRSWQEMVVLQLMRGAKPLNDVPCARSSLHTRSKWVAAGLFKTLRRLVPGICRGGEGVRDASSYQIGKAARAVWAHNPRLVVAMVLASDFVN